MVYFSVLALLAVFGFSACMACDNLRIEACVEPLSPYQGTTMTKEIMLQRCPLVKTASECLSREFASCHSSRYTEMKKLMLKTIDVIKAYCDNPDSISDIEDCNSESLQECSKDIQNNNAKGNPRQHCFNVGKAQRCVNTNMHSCKNEQALGMMKTLSAMIDKKADECVQRGYSIDSDEPALGNAAQPAITLILASVGLVFLRRYMM